MSNVILLPLPYPKNALEPYISAQTVDLHYSKHHAGYINTLNTLIQGSDLEGKNLEELIKASVNNDSRAAIFNNAGQAWNHNVYWQCMKAGGGGNPSGKLLEMIQKTFSSFDQFIETFTKKAVGHFGSGWAWLIQKNNSLDIVTTTNADSPFAHGIKTLFGIDIWEHAYYLDYQNRRVEYVNAFLSKLVNWDFIASNL